MRGIPKWLNSKQDVYSVVELALDGQFDKERVRKMLEDLKSDEKVYVFKQVVTEGYVPAGDERVCEVRKEDNSVEYHLYSLEENPNARYRQMGMTREELEGLIKELE